MISPASTNLGLRVALLLMVAAGAGCASKGDSLGGTGGGSGAAGAGGTTEGGGAPGTDGGGLTELQLLGALSVAGEEWGMFESRCPSYHYQIQHFGSCAATTVDVVNGQPTERSFTGDAAGCTPAADAGALEQWDEVGVEQLGSHGDGDPVRTVQELLNYCEGLLPTDTSKYTLSFTYGGYGEPTTCSATLINCAAACTTGFEISNFGCDQIPAG